MTVNPGKISGEIAAIPSKSHLHRLLIYAALSDRDTFICCRETEAEDIFATINCLTAIGAKITRQEKGFLVTPVKEIPQSAIFPCGESGSTLRFMLPVVCALGVRGAFEMKGRLPERPLSPLDEQLEKHGIRLWRDTPEILQCEGKLQTGEYYLPGNISSQYISGMLMAMVKTRGRLTVSAPVESAGYIDMTLEAAKTFDLEISISENTKGFEYSVNGEIKSPIETNVEGDWSNAAFWLCAGAMPNGNIKLSGLLENSSQGDREIVEILKRMGANIKYEENAIVVTENKRLATEIDARAIPDLIPVLAVVASVSEGTTVVRNASRLRIKESDRLMSVAKTLSALGADIKETDDGLIINGKERLSGGTIDAYGDHRIAMTAAIAATACLNPVTINGANAVNKSYPKFWDDLEMLKQ